MQSMLLAVLLLFLWTAPVYGENELLEEMDFTEVDQMLDETFEEDISFGQMVKTDDRFYEASDADLYADCCCLQGRDNGSGIL